MRTNEEILKKYSTWASEVENGQAIVIDLQDCKEAMKEAQKEIVEYILQKAADNAIADYTQISNYFNSYDLEVYVIKGSILSLKDEIIKELGL